MQHTIYIYIYIKRKKNPICIAWLVVIMNLTAILCGMVQIRTGITSNISIAHAKLCIQKHR